VVGTVSSLQLVKVACKRVARVISQRVETLVCQKSACLSKEMSLQSLNNNFGAHIFHSHTTRIENLKTTGHKKKYYTGWAKK